MARAQGAPTVHGFLQGAFSTRLTAPRIGPFISAEERAQIEIAGSPGHGLDGYAGKLDLFRDNVGHEWGTDLREGYLDLAFKNARARVGRQIVTWGVGDLLFVNDLFPKDWEAFFTGRPIEYLKLGVDAVKVDFYGKGASAEVVVMPGFRGDRTPRPSRFEMPSPFGALPVTLDTPEASLKNAQIAARVYGRLASFDASAYFTKGFFRSPSMAPDDPNNPTQLNAFYPELRAYGASLQGAVGPGVVSLEVGYYDSADDKSGSDPAVPNSQIKFLAGYSRALSDDLTVGGQYNVEQTQHYGAYLEGLPPGFPASPEWRHLLTARITQMRKHQTERLSLVAFWSPSDNDFFLIPQYRLQIDDATWIEAGLNMFGGKDTTLFGAFDKNDNLFLTYRKSF